MKKNIFLIWFFIFIFSNFSLADVYKCINPKTGEIFYTNLKNFLKSHYCQIYVRESRNFYINEKWFEEIGNTYGIDPALLKAIAKVESSFNPRAISHKGAIGIMQVLPTTAQSIGIENLFDPLENLKAGAIYLKKLLNEFGDLSLALAAYNAGPEAVRTYKGIPPYKETQEYVKKVLYYYHLYKSEI